MNIEKITEAMVQLTLKTLTGQALETKTYSNISVSLPLEISLILEEAAKETNKPVEELIASSMKEALTTQLTSFLKTNKKQDSSKEAAKDELNISEMLNIDGILNSFKELQSLTKDIQGQQEVFESMEQKT